MWPAFCLMMLAGTTEHRPGVILASLYLEADYLWLLWSLLWLRYMKFLRAMSLFHQQLCTLRRASRRSLTFQGIAIKRCSWAPLLWCTQDIFPVKACQQLSLPLDRVSLLIPFEVGETYLQWLPFLWHFLHIRALLHTMLTTEVEMLQVESNLLACLYCSDRSRCFCNPFVQYQDPPGVLFQMIKTHYQKIPK